MKSLRQLRDGLLNVRLAAVNTSLWQIVTTINERARFAINDALNVYEFSSQMMYSSINPTLTLQAVPSNVQRIISLSAREYGTGRYVEVTDAQLVPTPFTNLIRSNSLRKLPGSGSAAFELHYAARITELPEDTYLHLPVSTTALGMNCTGTVPVAVWPPRGFAELTYDNTLQREVVFYDAVTPTGFSNLIRAVEGQAVAWTTGARISCVANVQAKDVAVIMPAAEAVMYNYWLGHRAQYDQFVGIANLDQLDVDSLEALIRISEARAEARYRQTRKLPQGRRI